MPDNTQWVIYCKFYQYIYRKMYSVSRIYSEDLCPLARERYDESNTDCRDDHPKPGN